MANIKAKSTANITRLLNIMSRLRDPNGGCPWDLEQDYRSIARYTLEEAYEVVETIEQGDFGGLQDELGDLLLQVVFHAQMAAEEGRFDFEAVAGGVADKMIRRHPHVFADAVAENAGAVVTRWETIKAEELAERGKAHASVLDGVPTALPAATRSLKLQQKAARVGFDWSQTSDIMAKLQEEIGELSHEIAADAPKARMVDELGDVFFVLVNLARHLDIDPETALRSTNAKFERRFHSIEAELAAKGRTPAEASLDEMEALWQAAKQVETTG